MGRLQLLPILLISLLALACNRSDSIGTATTPTTDTATAPPSTNSGSDGWSWTIDAAGGFKVEMAGQPQRIEQPGNHFPQCGTVNCVVYSVQNPDANFLFNYWDLDTPSASNVPPDTLINTLRNAMASQDAQVISDQSVRLKSGQTGRECNFNRPSGTLTVRWVAANRKLYMLTYAGKTDDRAAHQKAAARFMNSIELTGGTSGRGGAAQPPTSPWAEYSDPQNRFRATFLGTPKQQKVQMANPKLGQVSFDICETKEAGLSMCVIEVTVAAPPGAALSDEQIINELRDAHVRRTNGQISNERAIPRQGLPGREVVVATARQGNATLRFFPYEGKFYMVAVQGLSGTPPAEDTARFLDSFRFHKVDGVVFSPTGGRFSARFKSTPQASNNPLPGPRGAVTETVYRVTTDVGIFSVGFVDYDGPAGQGATTDQIVAVLRDTAVRNTGARVLSELPIQMGIATGRELLAELPNGTQVRFRWLAQVRRVYSVGVVGVKPGPLPAEEVTRFMDSFKITP